MKEMHNLIQALSNLFGFQKTLSFIDACISDLFDAVSSRISRQRLVCDLEHSRWMERHFGLGVMVHFVSSHPEKYSYLVIEHSVSFFS